MSGLNNLPRLNAESSFPRVQPAVKVGMGMDGVEEEQCNGDGVSLSERLRRIEEGVGLKQNVGGTPVEPEQEMVPSEFVKVSCGGGTGVEGGETGSEGVIGGSGGNGAGAGGAFVRGGNGGYLQPGENFLECLKKDLVVQAYKLVQLLCQKEEELRALMRLKRHTDYCLDQIVLAESLADVRDPRVNSIMPPEEIKKCMEMIIADKVTFPIAERLMEERMKEVKLVRGHMQTVSPFPPESETEERNTGVTVENDERCRATPVSKKPRVVKRKATDGSTPGKVPRSRKTDMQPKAPPMQSTVIGNGRQGTFVDLRSIVQSPCNKTEKTTNWWNKIKNNSGSGYVDMQSMIRSINNVASQGIGGNGSKKKGTKGVRSRASRAQTMDLKPKQPPIQRKEIGGNGTDSEGKLLGAQVKTSKPQTMGVKLKVPRIQSQGIVRNGSGSEDTFSGMQTGTSKPQPMNVQFNATMIQSKGHEGNGSGTDSTIEGMQWMRQDHHNSTASIRDQGNDEQSERSSAAAALLKLSENTGNGNES